MIAAPDLPLLVVEDSDEDYTALRWALGKAGVARPVRRCATGAELFAYLREGGANAAWQAGPDAGGAPDLPAPPALILLDLNLGADDGRELLAELKADDALRRIPVVVWTTSAHPEDVDRCYASGASGYATKPVDAAQLVATLRDVARYWFEHMVLPEPVPRPRRRPA